MADKTGRTVEVEDLREQVGQVQEVQSTTVQVLNRIYQDMQGRLAPAAVLDQPRVVVPAQLTTPEEQVKYDEMVDKDFVETDPKTGKPVSTKQLYHVDHVRPQWQSANQDEYIAQFHISKFEWDRKVADKELYRKVLGNFIIGCREFVKKYKAALVSTVDEQK
jgi:hypothetical protein